MDAITEKVINLTKNGVEIKELGLSYLRLAEELIFEYNCEHNCIIIRKNDKMWTEVDTFYNIKKGLLLQVRRDFDGNKNEKWIVDNITDLQVEKYILNGEDMYI